MNNNLAAYLLLKSAKKIQVRIRVEVIIREFFLLHIQFFCFVIISSHRIPRGSGFIITLSYLSLSPLSYYQTQLEHTSRIVFPLVLSSFIVF